MRTRRLGVASAVIDGALVPGDVGVAGDRVAEVGLAGTGGRGIAAPGLIDLQVNGFGGVDLLADADDDAWRSLGRRLLVTGVTAYQPTLITGAEEATRDGLRRAGRLAVPSAGGGTDGGGRGAGGRGGGGGGGRGAGGRGGSGGRRGGGGGARILGVHLEGPFISPARLGAHPPAHRRDPDPERLRGLLASGPVSMVTLAPELSGATALVRTAAARGVTVSLGHSAADVAACRRAVAAGASAVTHVFNAMAPIDARAPGLPGCALASPRVFVMAIVDGAHLADETVAIVLACAAERLVLTSDAIAAAGTDAAHATLGSVPVTIDGGRATRSDGTLAGGMGTVADAVARLVGLGASPVTAINAATRNPAALLRRADVGNLRPGDRADLVVLDDAPDPARPLRVTRVLRDGAPVSGG